MSQAAKQVPTSTARTWVSTQRPQQGHDRSGYWTVDDINETLAAHLEAGAETQQPIGDVGGGKKIAAVRDAGGNVIGLLQAQAPSER